jgi:hypothetical protein
MTSSAPSKPRCRLVGHFCVPRRLSGRFEVVADRTVTVFPLDLSTAAIGLFIVGADETAVDVDLPVDVRALYWLDCIFFDSRGAEWSIGACVIGVFDELLQVNLVS